jgi:hypothetical protein
VVAQDIGGGQIEVAAHRQTLARYRRNLTIARSATHSQCPHVCCWPFAAMREMVAIAGGADI